MARSRCHAIAEHSFRSSLLAQAPDRFWDLYFNETITGTVFPDSFHAVVGSIFEDLVKRTCGLTLDERPIFVFHEGTEQEYRRIGDASFQDDTIVDIKATAEGIKSNNIAQLRDYEFITRPGIPDDQRIKGYFESSNPKSAERRAYRGILYIVATEAVADLVAAQIAEGFEMAMYPDRGAFWEVHPAIDRHPSWSLPGNFGSPGATRSGS